MKKILLTLLFLFVSACSGGNGVMDTPLTASNRDEIVQQAMPKMTDAERQLLLGYMARQMGSQMLGAMTGKPTADEGRWSILPEGKSLHDILSEQKDFESQQGK
jgi:hypothetical protein